MVLPQAFPALIRPRSWLLACLSCSILSTHLSSAETSDPHPNSTQTTVRPVDLCETSRRALTQASLIRGLAVLHEVPCVVQDKSQVKGFLQETIQTELPPQKIMMEEIAFRTVGLIPDDFNYGTELIEFLVSQIGGYYDPKQKRFVMAAWLPATLQHGVAVHELTHALQDQHYNLRKLLNLKSGTTDSDLAISALLEGDASAVMLDEQHRHDRRGRLQDLASIDSFLLLQVLGLNFGAQDSQVPDGLKAVLIFPYTSGLRFVHALLRKDGYARVDVAYTHPPTTTRQILHPEEFMNGSWAPDIPAASELTNSGSIAAPEYSDTLGEFAISSILSSSPASRSRAVEAAQGWMGDRLGIFPVKDESRRVVWVTRWQSITDADDFAAAYTSFVEARYRMKVPPSTLTPLTQDRSILIGTSAKSVRVEWIITARSPTSAPPPVNLSAW